MKRAWRFWGFGVAAAWAAVSRAAFANAAVGPAVSATGPAALFGISGKNVIVLPPKGIGGRGASGGVVAAPDSAKAATNARKLASEGEGDSPIGEGGMTNSLQLTDVAARLAAPMISPAAAASYLAKAETNVRKLASGGNGDARIGSLRVANARVTTEIAANSPALMISPTAVASIVEPLGATRGEIFNTPQRELRDDTPIASSIAEHVTKRGATMVAFGALVGRGDASRSEGPLDESGRAAAVKQRAFAAIERFARDDAPRAGAGRGPKAMSKPFGAALIAGADMPTALPPDTRNARAHRGAIHPAYGVANDDLRRACGSDCERTHLHVGRLFFADQHPDSNSTALSALACKRAANACRAGTASTFSGDARDAALRVPRAIAIAREHGSPGTPASRHMRHAACGSAKGRTSPSASRVFEASATDETGFG